MPSYSNIHSALTQSLIALNTSTLGGLPIAHEGRDFDPASSDLYLKLDILYGQRLSRTKRELDEALGVMQITVKQKTGIALSSILSVIDSILDNYRHNEALTYNNQRVVVINSTRNGGRNIDGWYTVNISVNFKSDDLR